MVCLHRFGAPGLAREATNCKKVIGQKPVEPRPSDGVVIQRLKFATHNGSILLLLYIKI